MPRRCWQNCGAAGAKLISPPRHGGCRTLRALIALTEALLFRRAAPCRGSGGGRRSKGQHALRRYNCFFLAGIGSYASPGRAASQGSNSSAFATACQSTDYGAGGRSAANFLDVALGVALALPSDSRSLDRLIVN